jgi:uncharacterized protein YndB with AHSA1/START domain
MTGLPEFILDREFDAPRDMVWQAWTNPEHLNIWYGPGVDTVIHKFDLEPEGLWLNEMKMKNGSFFQKVIFKEVVKHEKLVWHHCSSDSDWNVVASPMMPDWPRMLLTTVTFEEQAGKTNVRLTQIPLDATDAEIACFAQMKDGMSGGWGGGYTIIDGLLEGMKSK